MQDVNMGDVFLPGAILYGIGQVSANMVAETGRMVLDLL
jgi:hypothetical protein